MLVRLGVFIFWLIHFLPSLVLVWIGNTLGILLYLLVAERRNVSTINLKLCFPELSDEARKKLLRDHFKMFARGLIERSILWWSIAEYISSLIRVEDVEHFEAMKDKPAILLTPISSAWMSVASGSLSMPMRYAGMRTRRTVT
jgi:Kdo2-lipid IVA lauroyltransferase/acyltransferase